MKLKVFLTEIIHQTNTDETIEVAPIRHSSKKLGSEEIDSCLSSSFSSLFTEFVEIVIIR